MPCRHAGIMQCKPSKHATHYIRVIIMITIITAMVLPPGLADILLSAHHTHQLSVCLSVCLVEGKTPSIHPVCPVCVCGQVYGKQGGPYTAWMDGTHCLIARWISLSPSIR
mmetsp:Transcript_46293/g.115160  ORF Transcript_46293/g.115160 Transcript_46293/m.115160 type:complete len:111 (+) Transcript_46293:1562-1894(+)